MIFGQDRNELRRMYVETWRKAESDEPLSPLEGQIAQVIRDHPEYQSLMREAALEAAYTPEGGQTNPFLHMGLHLAIREQIATKRPKGIETIFNSLLRKYQDLHEVEHRMIECLAETLWEAQRNSGMPDENAYLERLKALRQ
jgi:hypothetical protein